MKKVVQDLTSGGIDWQREKWQSGLGSKFIHQGEKNAVKYADEVIVLSKGVQDYFKETYGRETHFIPNGVNRPQIREASLITDTRLRNKIFRKYKASGYAGVEAIFERDQRNRSSYGECMTAFAECSAGKHGKAAAFGQNTHISVHQRQMFVKLLSILRPCNVHGFCL